jgi:hypothetical protein
VASTAAVSTSIPDGSTGAGSRPDAGSLGVGGSSSSSSSQASVPAGSSAPEPPVGSSGSSSSYPPQQLQGWRASSHARCLCWGRAAKAVGSRVLGAVCHVSQVGAAGHEGEGGMD